MSPDARLPIVTRVILQPAGGGDPVDVFDRQEGAEVEDDTVLAVYTRRFGEPVEVAYTEVPGADGPVAIGWVFAVPAAFEVPGTHEQYEMLLIPMVDDPGSGERVSLFVRLSEQRQRFQAAFDSGDFESLTHVTLEHRHPDEQPTASTETQRRDR